ncbi:hypothetical protein FCULG_00000330 [Fusarium culmorum]|uniref:Uncharacterized protein n=1 Tax=Fusarium culmorum TaxID=5516 RepID=A0A2T4GNA8_FUSCU|nr:hypothetical protein FCULG_00000330 [Fusarium culmorum]
MSDKGYGGLEWDQWWPRSSIKRTLDLLKLDFCSSSNKLFTPAQTQHFFITFSKFSSPTSSTCLPGEYFPTGHYMLEFQELGSCCNHAGASCTSDCSCCKH